MRKEFKDLITCCIINTFEDTSIVSQANWKNNMDKIVNYFVDIRDKLKLQEIKILLSYCISRLVLRFR
jgi:hypothetical protein